MTDREVCEHNRRICDPCEYCGTARNRKSSPTGGEIVHKFLACEMADEHAKVCDCQIDGIRKQLSALQAENEALKMRVAVLEAKEGK